MHFAHGIVRVALGPVSILFVLQIGFEDRFQYQNRRHLDHSIPDDGYAQGSLFPIGLRDIHPANRRRTITLVPQPLRQFSNPSAHSIGLDLLEADSIDSGCPAVGTASPPRLGQNILPTELVIERVKPITRISLRFGMQRFLQLPELKWRR